MFNNRSDKRELLDDLSLSSDELRKNLAEFEKFNNWFGSKRLLTKSLNKIKNKFSNKFHQNPITLCDLCCGGGDLLRAIEKWSSYHGIKMTLIGIDANPSIIDYAIKNSTKYPLIQYKVHNVFSPELEQMKFDIVSINSACHHFNNEDLIKLLQLFSKQTRLAIVINDLHRYWLSYYAIKLISKIFKFSELAKHDAPLSVMRAFTKNDLIEILEEANIKQFEIHWAWPFRWSVIIWLSN